MLGIAIGLALLASLIVEVLFLMLGRDSIDIPGVVRVVLHAATLVLAIGFAVALVREVRRAGG